MAMTPEERARADAINEAISRFAKERKQGVQAPAPPPVKSIPGTTQDPPSRRSNGPSYVIFAAIVLAVHALAFFVYVKHTEKKERETAELIEAATARQKDEMEAAVRVADAEVERFKKNMRQLSAKPTQQINASTPQPKTNPEPEYNVYKDPSQSIRTRPQVQQFPQPTSPEPAAPAKADRKFEHQMVAQAYLAHKKGVLANVVSIEQVPGWEGRYRTQFEMSRKSNIGTSPSPRKYEVITQEKDGKITGVDATTKGY